MAFISQEEKQKLSPAIKAICKKYGLKGSLSIRDHFTLVLTIASGTIDFFESYNRLGNQRPSTFGWTNKHEHIDVNVYWCHEHFDGKAKDFLAEVIAAMKGPDWFDKSDIQTDYFHVKHYVDVNIGRWNKAYIKTA